MPGESEKDMTSIESKIKNALVEYGAMNENWRLKITNKGIISNSDYASFTVEIYKPRCRKPCTEWTLIANIVREFVDFGKSTFVRL